MKLSRLHGRKVNEYVLRKGNVWKGRCMVIRWLSGAPRNPNVDPAMRALYVGTAVSAKLSKSAVKRNRMRRRCREALRITVRETKELPTLQLLIAPRSSSLDCVFADLLRDVRDFLSSVPNGATK